LKSGISIPEYPFELNSIRSVVPPSIAHGKLLRWSNFPSHGRRVDLSLNSLPGVVDFEGEILSPPKMILFA